MVLIAILFCLSLQRFANVGGWFQLSWFEIYLKILNRWLVRLNEWVAVAIIVAPILLFLALLHFLFMHTMFGIIDLILATSVLFLCIDVRDYKIKLASYFANLEKNMDLKAAANSIKNFNGDFSSVATSAELIRTVTKAILLNSFEQFFAGLFWFIVFGIYGVVFYFLITLLRTHTLKIDSNYDGIAKVATQLHDILDWIPSRLIGISYALVGNFNKGFDHFNKYLWSSLDEVRKFSVEVGIAALDLGTDTTKVTQQENYAALDLINRVLILWLIILSLTLVGFLL
jgi:AmpE protein